MTYTFDLDMTPGGVPEVVQLSRYDKKIPELEFTLWNGPGAYIIPEGASVFISGTKPDKTGFEYECTYSDSVVTVTVEEQMTAVAGRVICELSVITAEGKKGSANFYMDIEPSALADDTVISETDIPIIQRIPEILAEVEAAKYLAEQWAVGSGSGQDDPSDTNNAYYWAMQAASYAGGGLKPEVVQALPTTNISTSTLYFVPSQSPTTSNIYDEYINIDGTTQGWELIGTTAIDMNNYYTKTEANTLLAAKQDSTDNNLNTTSKQIVGAINELKASMASTDIVSDQYDETATYDVGDYCIYNNALYKCTTAVPVAEAFDSNKWELTNCGIEFKQLNTDLSEKDDIVLLGTVNPTSLNTWATTTPSEPISNFKKVLVVLKQNDTGVIFLSKEFYTDTLSPIGTSGYNAMDSLYHSSSYTIYAMYKITDSIIGTQFGFNSWIGSTTKVSFYGVK